MKTRAKGLDSSGKTVFADYISRNRLNSFRRGSVGFISLTPGNGFKLNWYLTAG
jgi:hypothetical protein